ncbi:MULTISPECIES: bestrophin family protein [unclassified Oceanobacter]|uniref:bestrophin family protein n=1 Tax=unclassified Oceanobacter TaxID=2620260 RepID=UPI002736FF77|nr:MULTISPECIES: bestrophin family ion channel [unclassified Oceanobacter]MDP2608269.1 bestrophin family ion channel [Oceanobacter sp. 1_MG-2023]MDP2612154.1 bestrophin family ion channel [Oceanobacter sp. 2_MG-2023]
MIVRERPHALALLFVWRGSILPNIAWHLLGLLVFAAAVVVVHTDHWANLARYSVAPFTLLGIALSLFLGFRNNACYDRWWEGRRQWGRMVSEVRSLARSTHILLPSERRAELLAWCSVFYHALRLQLRQQPLSVAVLQQELPDWVLARLSTERLAQVVEKGNVADGVGLAMAETLRQAYAANELDTQGIRILNEHLSSLAAIQAASERLASTPLPFAYSLLTHRTAYLYCYLLPFGLVGSLGWMMPVFIVIVAYTFFGLDALAQQLEEPFGHDANHLPLASLCRVNDRSLAQAQGLPLLDMLAPNGDVLD